MTYEKIAMIAAESGFTNWAPLAIATIELKEEVRAMCANNACGQYGKRWSCPPGCGTLEECAKQLQNYSYGILVQTVGDVEDSFDFESMMEIETVHKTHFKEMYSKLREQTPNVLALGSGCCTHCTTCTYPDKPCRFPDEKISSMEAYGMLVLEVCKANNLPYYYGSDKIAYTSCFML